MVSQPGSAEEDRPAAALALAAKEMTDADSLEAPTGSPSTSSRDGQVEPPLTLPRGDAVSGPPPQRCCKCCACCTCCYRGATPRLLGTLGVLAAALFVWSVAQPVPFAFGACLGGATLVALAARWVRRRRAAKRDAAPAPGADPVGDAPAGRAACLTRTALITLLVFLSVLLLVRVASVAAPPPGGGDAFPSGCYPNFGGMVPIDCTRVAAPQGDAARARGIATLTLLPDGTTTESSGDGAQEGLLRVRAPRGAVVAAVRRWADSLPRSRTRRPTAFLTHAIAMTAVMGYVDDLFARVACDGDEAVLSIHFEQRLGSGDLGLNERRARDLRSHVTERAPPEGDCGDPWP